MGFGRKTPPGLCVVHLEFGISSTRSSTGQGVYKVSINTASDPLPLRNGVGIVKHMLMVNEFSGFDMFLSYVSELFSCSYLVVNERSNYA